MIVCRSGTYPLFLLKYTLVRVSTAVIRLTLSRLLLVVKQILVGLSAALLLRRMLLSECPCPFNLVVPFTLGSAVLATKPYYELELRFDRKCIE